MNRKIILLVLCVLSCAGVLAARSAEQSTSWCFENDGLKSVHRVNLVMRGAKMSGIYSIEPYETSAKSIEREFHGTSTRTKTGWLLQIRFPKGAPYELAPHQKRIRWRLGRRGGLMVLVVPTYGKNYQTGKYTAYEMQLPSCI